MSTIEFKDLGYTKQIVVHHSETSRTVLYPASSPCLHYWDDSGIVCKNYTVEHAFFGHSESPLLKGSTDERG